MPSSVLFKPGGALSSIYARIARNTILLELIKRDCHAILTDASEPNSRRLVLSELIAFS